MSNEAVGIIVAILVQTLALGFWGGNLSRIVKDHDREINKEPGGLRFERHRHAGILTQHEFRLTELEKTHEKEDP